MDSTLLIIKQLCSESEAYLGLLREKVMRVDADHVALSEFPSRTDAFFDVLLGELHEVIDALKLPMHTHIQIHADECNQPSTIVLQRLNEQGMFPSLVNRLTSPEALQRQSTQTTLVSSVLVKRSYESSCPFAFLIHTPPTLAFVVESRF